MHRLPGLGCVLAVILIVSVAHAAPPVPAPVHPTRPRLFQNVRARWQQGRALRRLEKIILAKPRLSVKFEERYGKLGGKKQFTARGPLAMLGIGTAVNIGGFIQSELLIPYLVAGAALDLSAFATHVIGNRRQRRKTLVSMIEDGTISNTDLRPFRKALGMTERGHKLGGFPLFGRPR